MTSCLLLVEMVILSVATTVFLVLGMVYMIRGAMKFSRGENIKITTILFRRTCALFASSFFATSLVVMIDISLGLKSEWNIFGVIFIWAFAGLFGYLSRNLKVARRIPGTANNQVSV